MNHHFIIVPYDPDWPRRFDEERAVLARVFDGTNAVIEHIGSTAVPGLGAKPVIDVLIGVRSFVEVEERIQPLEAEGYQYVPKYERQWPDRRYFRKPRLEPRAFHVHCVIRESSAWVRHLAFRDYLRAHPETAAAYDHFKRELAARVSKADYPAAKGSFVESVLASATREREA